MRTIYHDAWFRDDGNNTHAITYPIDQNSVVVDLGAYKGVWASQIINKYNPFVILLEPVPQFYHELVNKFSGNPKVRVLNVGISSTATTGSLYVNGDATSMYLKNNLQQVDVKFISSTELLSIAGRDIDLVQINIEGEEYTLLESMIADGTINKYKNIQIQFHTFIEGHVSRREDIQQNLSKSFNKLYDYPFVFEGWSLKNNI